MVSNRLDTYLRAPVSAYALQDPDKTSNFACVENIVDYNKLNDIWMRDIYFDEEHQK
jgi:hypothetical protein